MQNAQTQNVQEQAALRSDLALTMARFSASVSGDAHPLGCTAGGSRIRVEAAAVPCLG